MAVLALSFPLHEHGIFPFINYFFSVKIYSGKCKGPGCLLLHLFLAICFTGITVNGIYFLFQLFAAAYENTFLY